LASCLISVTETSTFQPVVPNTPQQFCYLMRYYACAALSIVGAAIVVSMNGCA